MGRRISRRELVMLCAVVASVAGVSAAAGPADERAITATMDAMATATVAKDMAALASIYGDDLMYGHSTGLVWTKAEVLKDPSQSESLKFSETAVRVYGDVALVKGIVDFRTGLQPGKLSDNHLNVLWVLVRRAGGPYGWQIVARQTTRIGPSVGTPVPRR